MLFDQSRTSGGINLFYAGRNAAELGEEYYREQEELAGSTTMQRATRVGIAGFGLHSVRNMSSAKTGYNKSLLQSLKPGKTFTSGLGVGYALFGGDDSLADPFQILGTAAAFKYAKRYNLKSLGSRYVEGVADAFINNKDFVMPPSSKINQIEKHYNRATRIAEHNGRKNIKARNYYLNEFKRNKTDINNFEKPSRSFFGSRKADNLRRANILSKQSEIVSTINKLHPVVKQSNSFTSFLTMGVPKAGKNISVPVTKIKPLSAVGVTPRSPEQIINLAKRLKKAPRNLKQYTSPPGKFLRTMSGAAGVAALAGYAGFKIAEASLEAFQKGLNIAQNASRLDFGDGMAFNSGEAMTERQRALSAMANSNMNARSFMGSEANFYS